MRCRDPAPRNRRSTQAAASLADRRVGLARLVRVRHRPRPVHSRLQPHPRRRQRIVVGLTEALVESATAPARRTRNTTRSRASASHPRPRGAAPTHRPSRRRPSHAIRRARPSRPRPRSTRPAFARASPRPRRSLQPSSACSARSAYTIPPSGWKSPVSPFSSWIGKRRPVSARSSTSNGTPHAASASRCRLPVSEIDRAGLVEQRAPPAGLELPPERICLLRQPHPAFLGIREANDARAAVTRAVAVSDLELLADHHAPSRPGERPCRGEAHHSGADDGDLGVGTRLHDRSVALRGVGAGEQSSS